MCFDKEGARGHAGFFPLHEHEYLRREDAAFGRCALPDFANPARSLEDFFHVRQIKTLAVIPIADMQLLCSTTQVEVKRWLVTISLATQPPAPIVQLVQRLH